MVAFLIAMLVVTGVQAPPAHASFITITLEEMIRESELIVIGTVTNKGETTGETFEVGKQEFRRLLPFYIATITVTSVVKGSPSLNELKVNYSDLAGVTPLLNLQERAVFFVTTLRGDEQGAWKGKQVVLQGVGGELLIEADMVKTPYIKDEPKEQKLNDLLEKIRRILSTEHGRKSKAKS